MQIIFHTKKPHFPANPDKCGCKTIPIFVNSQNYTPFKYLAFLSRVYTKAENVRNRAQRHIPIRRQ